jgi:ABC-type transporter Mla subunit MlaD
MTTYPATPYQPETLAALDKLRATAPNTIAERSALAGFRMAEPYLVIADQLIRIAKAYKNEFGRTIAEDYMANSEFAAMLSGLRGMLNFDGAALWEANHNSNTRRTRDTKDNQLIDTLIMTACEIAGIDPNEL